MNRALPIVDFAEIDRAATATRARRSRSAFVSSARKPARRLGSPGFTLIEILVASIASALILLAVYGIFQRAMKTRDHAVERMHEARLQSRTANVIRNDLRNAFVSGGVLACTLEGGAQSQKSRFPGYLRFTATTGKDNPDEALGDVQQVEYYIAEETNSGETSGPASRNTGTLVRALTRDLLATVPQVTREERLLRHVQTFEVAFYDGQTWLDTWQVTDSAPTLPQAIRVRLQQAPSSDRATTPPPLEILVACNTQPQISSTTSTTTSASGTAAR